MALGLRASHAHRVPCDRIPLLRLYAQRPNETQGQGPRRLFLLALCGLVIALSGTHIVPVADKNRLFQASGLRIMRHQATLGQCPEKACWWGVS